MILEVRFWDSIRDLVSSIRFVRRPVRIMAAALAWAKAIAVALPMPLPWLGQLSCADWLGGEWLLGGCMLACSSYEDYFAFS